MKNLHQLNQIFKSRIMPPEYRIFFDGEYFTLFEKKGSNWKPDTFLQFESLDELEKELEIRRII